MGMPLPMSQGQVRTLKSSDTLLPCVFSISVLHKVGWGTEGVAEFRDGVQLSGLCRLPCQRCPAGCPHLALILHEQQRF